MPTVPLIIVTLSMVFAPLILVFLFTTGLQLLFLLASLFTKEDDDGRP